MKFLGVDPGAKGGIALINDDNNTIEVLPYNEDNLVQICNKCEHNNTICTIEKVHAMPHQGVVSMFNFGANYGFIQGVIYKSNVMYDLVTPQMWKKEFNLIGKDKLASIEKAKELFPKVNLFATKRSRKESDGMAEALLIAEFGRRIYGRKNK